MARKLLIIMVNTDPRDATALCALLTQASVAAAMNYPVEIILSGRSAELAIKGVAAQVALADDPSRTVQDLIHSARELGVKLKVCTTSVERWGDDLLDAIDGIVGGAYLISEAMDGETLTLSY